VDLNQVGIPKPSQENGSKLIFTTRSLEVGDENLNSHPDIWELAKQVAERCGGLPLAVITMGCAMACKTTPVEWKYAIEKLKRSSLTKMKNEKLNFFFVKAGCQLFEEPNVKAWEYVKRMSVMKNQIEILREPPCYCHNLRTLFLSKNKLEAIRYNYFQYARYLTVLNLSENRGLRTLPLGISDLISLECLDLSYTGIRELSIILKALKKLKMLELSYMEDLRRIARHLISSFSKLQPIESVSFLERFSSLHRDELWPAMQQETSSRSSRPALELKQVQQFLLSILFL
ncbi:hypothetical protein Golob_006650, partial [Gossypium lobatum]|nr:hypothetical protein [Gossypium lobatum]